MIDLNTYTREQLISMIETLGFDANFGMFQRDYAIRAIDGQFGDVMFLDIDDFKELNTRLGYQEANRLVNDAFSVFTSNKSYVVFRWFSGDEIVIFSRGGIWWEDTCNAHQKLSFTAAIGKVQGNLIEVVNALSVKVMRAKKTGQKGIIVNSE